MTIEGLWSEVSKLAKYVHSLVKEIADLERRLTKLEKKDAA